MKSVQELSEMVTLVSYLKKLMDSNRNAVKKNEINALGNLILRLDREIVQESLGSLKTPDSAEQEDMDISRKIVEAKLKLQQSKTNPSVPASSQLAQVQTPQVVTVKDAEPEQVQTKRTFKRSNKNELQRST